MKISTMMAVIAIAVAFAAPGCKYSSINNGKNGSGAGGLAGAQGSDISSSVGDDGMEGSIANAGERPFEEYCTRCTDVDFAPVYFGFDSTVVPQGEVGKIDAVIQHLSSKPERVVVIEGNCDERGSNEYNLSLGQLRAIAIRDYLVQLGVNVQSVQDKSYGEEKPAVVGSNEAAWSKNRRGEFAVYAHK